LKRVDLGGGLPQTLANAGNGRGGTWSSSGVILFSTTGSPILRIPASGGEPVAVTNVVAPQATHRFPQFLPDGRQFLFYAVTVGAAPEARGIYLGTLDSSETRRLTAADTAGLYTSGWLLFVRQGTLVARRFDPARGELTGDPVTIADSVPFDNATNAGGFSISTAGLVAYRTGAASRNQLIWFDRSGKMLGAVGAPDDAIFDPRVSPDGRRVAADRSVQGNLDVWILDAVRTTRFTFDAGYDAGPSWSRDANSIAFTSIRKGVYSIYQKASNGTGVEEKLLPDSRLALTLCDWSADGRFLLYQILEPKTSYDMWILPLEGDRKPRVFLQTEFDERDGRFSPDGRWVAYRSNESGRNEIYVRSFPEPGGQWQISTAGGSGPRWRRDGKELYYIAPDGRLMAVPIASQGATLEPGTPLPLFQTRIFGGGNNAARAQYDVAPDGRFLINTLADDAVTSSITLLLNWHPPDK
jgi:Tol biopolymer transport system component